MSEDGANGTARTGRAAGRFAAVEARLTQLRGDARERRLALAAAVVAGLGLSALHWIGLFVAGALIGLTRQSLGRALAAGFAFGVAVLAVFFVVTPLLSPGNVLVLAPLSYVTIALALVAPAWGALVRGVV